MATAVVMPKQGNSVESCIIVEWKKQVGDTVAQGDALCDVETDKTTMEVPSPVAGILLAIFAAAGDEVPVMTNIAAIGMVGEDVSGLNPQAGSAESGIRNAESSTIIVAQEIAPHSALHTPHLEPQSLISNLQSPISPRAKNLAERKGVEIVGLVGSGPEGRIIERDIDAAIRNSQFATPKLTPIAKAMVAEGGFAIPSQGSGPGGRVTSKDLVNDDKVTRWQGDEESEPISNPQSPILDEITTLPVKGVRKLIAERMLASLQTTAQLTMNSSADARALRTLRERFKNSPEAMGLRGVSINDLVLFAVSRALLQHPSLNALFADNTIAQHKHVHLGFAVDTPRGLLVPVIRNADRLTLKQIAQESKRLAQAVIDNKSSADDLNGGTFTISNLGAFGIETFTPVLNPPQVAILGVGNIGLKAVEKKSQESGVRSQESEVQGQSVEFIPHINLSLTINHQVVDGAPAARFLQTLAQSIAGVDLLLAG